MHCSPKHFPLFNVHSQSFRKIIKTGRPKERIFLYSKKKFFSFQFENCKNNIAYVIFTIQLSYHFTMEDKFMNIKFGTYWTKAKKLLNCELICHIQMIFHIIVPIFGPKGLFQSVTQTQTSIYFKKHCEIHRHLTDCAI